MSALSSCACHIFITFDTDCPSAFFFFFASPPPSAAIARLIYLKKGLGVGALQRHFGGRMRKGTRTEKFRKSSAGVIRTILQQLESSGTIVKWSVSAPYRLSRVLC